MEDRILKTPAMTICGASFRPRGKREQVNVSLLLVTTPLYEECGNIFLLIWFLNGDMGLIFMSEATREDNLMFNYTYTLYTCTRSCSFIMLSGQSSGGIW